MKTEIVFDILGPKLVLTATNESEWENFILLHSIIKSRGRNSSFLENQSKLIIYL